MKIILAGRILVEVKQGFEMLFLVCGTLAWQRLIQAQQSRALIQTYFCEIRILQSDISFKNLSVKGFYKRSKHFPSVDRFNNSQNFFSYLIRKLMCTLYIKKIRTLKSVADNFYKSKSLQSTKIGRESSKLVWHGPG